MIEQALEILGLAPAKVEVDPYGQPKPVYNEDIYIVSGDHLGWIKVRETADTYESESGMSLDKKNDGKTKRLSDRVLCGWFSDYRAALEAKQYRYKGC